jgi:hypothetical protein
MTVTIISSAEKGLLEIHHRYGEEFRLLKYIPSATGGIYRQPKKIYESEPYILKGSIARTPVDDILSPIGESSQLIAKITIPVKFVTDLFGGSTSLLETITTKDLIIFDERVWRITKADLTGRVGDKPLLFILDLREKLGEKEKEYL